MRRCSLFLAFVFGLSSVVGLFNPSAYAASTLRVNTSRPFVGQAVVFSGTIGTAGQIATLQRSGSKGWINTRNVKAGKGGSFKLAIATSSARRSFRVVINGKGVKTNTVTLITRSLESAPSSATLSTPKKPYAGQPFKLSGDTGAPGDPRTAVLQRRVGRKWVNTRKDITSGGGKYEFSVATSAASRAFRVLVPPAKTFPAVKSLPVLVETKKNNVGLVLSRVGTSRTIIADGYLNADLEGRQVDLQVAGKGWSTVKSGRQGKDNRVRFAIGVLKGGASRTYRLVAKSSGTTPQVVSNKAALSYGPSSLGDRVAYVQTRSGGTPKKKGKDYAATIIIAGQVATLETIAVRGNTSATYPKQGYKIKFDDNVIPIKGIPRGKTFNLLPDYQDRSLIRTAVTFRVADKMDRMGWNPTRAFVELYLNGKYKGAYDLIESVKIDQASKKGAARINVSPKTGVVIEIDPYGAKDKVPHWKSKKSKLPFKFKDPDEKSKPGSAEGWTTAKAKRMKAKVAKFESVLYGSNWKDPKNGWTRYMSMESAVDWYLVKEFIKDWDGDMYRSNFFYTSNYDDVNAVDPKSRLVMAPIWDVDRSAAAKTSGTSNVTSPSGWWMNGDGGGHLNNTDNVHTTHWFVRIAKDPRFQRALRDRWAVRKPVFRAAGNQYVDDAVAELGKNVAANDRRLWAKTGDAKRYLPRAGTYNREVGFVKNWYKKRYNWMDSQLR
jgi:hypothetical protein